MFLIDTSKKDWQKRMTAQMNEGESFRLLTTSEDLAKSLDEGKLNRGALKFFLMGTGVGFTGGFTAARLLNPSFLSKVIGVVVNLDPEPVSRSVIALVSATAGAVSVYYVYRMVEKLVKGQYNFRIIQQNAEDEWVIEARPAEAGNGATVMSEEG